MLLPPVECVEILDAGLSHPPINAERNQKNRHPSRLLAQGDDAVRVQMIVMIVRNQHDVDMRKIG